MLALSHSYSHSLWVTSSQSLLITSLLVPFTASLATRPSIMHVNHLLAVFTLAAAVLTPSCCTLTTASSSGSSGLQGCRSTLVWFSAVASPKEFHVRCLTSSQLVVESMWESFRQLQLLPGSAMYVRRNPESPGFHLCLSAPSLER